MKPIILLNNGCNHFCGWCHETIHCGKAFMDIKDKYPIEYLYALFSIMPNELEKYINIGIDTFKISSRNGDLTYLKKTIDSYINIREKEYIDKDINNYLLWSRLRWFLNYFKTFNYDRIIEYKNEIWKHEMVDYSSLQYKNDLMTNKGIIIDLSDKYSVLDVPIEKFHDLNLKLLRPFKTHIKGVIYGSSTCSKFIDAINVNKIIEKYKIAKEKGLETYFITPNVKEEYFEKYKQLIEVLIDNNLLDYLIANDYGIIELFHNRVPIILGRLFDKRNRDFRVNISYSCDELGVISEEYLNYYKEHKIKGITVEQLGNEKYSSIEMIKKIYINFPYIIESCGNICELSGISKEYSNKFKNDKCNFDCLKYSAYTKYDQTTVYKYMNSIYYSISLNESIINYFSNDKNEIIIKYFEV